MPVAIARHRLASAATTALICAGGGLLWAKKLGDRVLAEAVEAVEPAEHDRQQQADDQSQRSVFGRARRAACDALARHGIGTSADAMSAV